MIHTPDLTIARKKAIKVNKILVNMEKKPVGESELIHILLEKSMPYVDVNLRGEIVIEK